MENRKWLARGVWLATAVAAGFLGSLLMSQRDDLGSTVLLARRPTGGSMVAEYDGGSVAVGAGHENRECVFFLDGRANTLNVLKVHRERQEVEATDSVDIGEDFKISGRGSKGAFIMLVGDRDGGDANVYLLETKTGTMRVYVADVSAGRAKFSKGYKVQLGAKTRQRVR